MTKFEFIPTSRKDILNRFSQKLKAQILKNNNINPPVKLKIQRYLKNKEIQEFQITKEEIINTALELIKEENGGVLPDDLQKLKN